MRMDKNKIIAILENEITCVKHANTCDRDCGKCPLVSEDTEIISALQYAIAAIRGMKSEPNMPSDYTGCADSEDIADLLCKQKGDETK